MSAYNTIQHLSGTTAEWVANDIVIPNGEWAFEELLDGTKNGKIGNGVDSWIELPYVFQAPRDQSKYNDWTLLWDYTCNGDYSTYTFTEDQLGNPIDYSELYIEFYCNSAAQTATTTIELDEAFTVYLTEVNFPTTSPLLHTFLLNAQLQTAYRTRNASTAIATTQFSKLTNTSDTILNKFTFLHIFNDKSMKYPNETIIKIWGK